MKFRRDDVRVLFFHFFPWALDRMHIASLARLFFPKGVRRTAPDER